MGRCVAAAIKVKVNPCNREPTTSISLPTHPRSLDRVPAALLCCLENHDDNVIMMMGWWGENSVVNHRISKKLLL
jgi:hypothetical protein